MLGNNIFSILHISDLHFSKKYEMDQEIVRDALIADVKNVCIGHRQPRAIVFTGDLIRAGGEDSPLEAYDFIIEPLAEAAKCPIERVFLVPGNHECRRNNVQANLEQLRRARENQKTKAEANQLFLDQAYSKYVEDNFQDYYEIREFLSLQYLVYENSFVQLYRIENPSLEFVVVNTAALSGAGVKEFGGDFGKLLIPEFALDDVAKRFSPKCTRILASHHPISWLSEVGAKVLAQFINRHCSFHYFGHMHDPVTNSISNFEGNVLTNQSGAIYSGRDRYIGYALISTDIQNNLSEVHLRSYYDERRMFDSAVNVTAGGKFYSSEEASKYWKKLAKPLDYDEIHNLLKSTASTLLDDEDEGGAFGEKKRRDIFVAPPLQHTKISDNLKDQDDTFDQERICFDDVVCDNQNVIFHAPAEYGRTTVLKQLEYELCAKAHDLKHTNVPILINFSEISQNLQKVKKILERRLLEVCPGYAIDDF